MANDTVLEQTQTIYDGDSNAIGAGFTGTSGLGTRLMSRDLSSVEEGPTG